MTLWDGGSLAVCISASLERTLGETGSEGGVWVWVPVDSVDAVCVLISLISLAVGRPCATKQDDSMLDVTFPTSWDDNDLVFLVTMEPSCGWDC